MILYLSQEIQKVRIPDDIYSEITKVRSDVKQYSRINAIPAYVSSKKRNDTSVEVLEQVFGVKIDYYVNMNLEGFKYIVDAVGPIYMDIPRPLKYSDPLQNLYINLDAGYQPLNGAQAEQLVRYRKGYANADIGRIDMQHEFMKAFMEQVLEPDKKFNMVTILETIFNHVTTNFTDAVDYLIYIDDISADKISMTTLPGAGSKTDGSYEYDQAASKELIEGIINKKRLFRYRKIKMRRGNKQPMMKEHKNQKLKLKWIQLKYLTQQSLPFLYKMQRTSAD